MSSSNPAGEPWPAATTPDAAVSDSDGVREVERLRRELQTVTAERDEARRWARLYYQVDTYRVAYWPEFGLERGTEPEWLTYYDPWHPAEESGDYQPSPLPWREQLRQAGILRDP